MELNESHDFKRLRILFIAVQLNHSGIYICTVSNAFETVEKTLELIVWPHGQYIVVCVLSCDHMVYVLSCDHMVYVLSCDHMVYVLSWSVCCHVTTRFTWPHGVYMVFE